MTLPIDEGGVRVACPSCGQRNRVPFDRLGEVGRCGSCQTALPVPDAPLEVPDPAAFRALVGGTALPVLVDFWASWCGPCLMVAPELEELARVQAGRLLVAKVDTDGVPEPGAALGIRSIPTLVLFATGREAGRLVGAHPAEGIAEFVEQSLRRARG